MREEIEQLMIEKETEIQKRVNHWKKQIEILVEEEYECIEIGCGFTKGGLLREFKGKIYATNTIKEILGLNIDTSFN